MNPYRSNRARPPRPTARARHFDRDVAGIYLGLWIVCVVCVILGVVLHERFAVGLTVATAAVCLLPVLARA